MADAQPAAAHGWRTSDSPRPLFRLALGARPSPDGQLYDLQHDEAGRHTKLARWVEPTSELAERLRREPNISAASTYSELTATARRTVGSRLAQSRDRIA